MTTFVSIMLYLLATMFFGAFRNSAAKKEDSRDLAVLLSFFIALFLMAAGLQVFA